MSPLVYEIWRTNMSATLKGKPLETRPIAEGALIGPFVGLEGPKRHHICALFDCVAECGHILTRLRIAHLSHAVVEGRFSTVGLPDGVESVHLDKEQEEGRRHGVCR